jgi:hypothetical protein
MNRQRQCVQFGAKKGKTCVEDVMSCGIPANDLSSLTASMMAPAGDEQVLSLECASRCKSTVLKDFLYFLG